ncbi:hypothetical protein [Sphingomonas faeni]|uniref:hypothetical protein n=1 Tax=Sphingomonas faeni TaxID=185950 RepID=UPI003F6D9721
MEHEAWNRSDRLRAILIFDVWDAHITGKNACCCARSSRWRTPMVMTCVRRSGISRQRERAGAT